MKKPCLYVAFFALLYISCEKNNDENKPIELTTNEKSIVAANNNFAIDIFKEINNQDSSGNIFISPLSIGMALAMTYNGAEGDTKEEIGSMLGFKNVGDSSLNISYKGVYDALMAADNDVEVSLANSIWYTDEWNVNQTFSEIIQNYYYGIISPIDLTKPDEAKDIINGWVEENTNNKIKDLIKVIKPTDVMFLVNAIYFNASWTYEFDKKETIESSFYKEDGSLVLCQMMSVDNIKIKNYYDEDYTLLELPYENEQFSMVILLPNEDKSVGNVIAALEIENINQVLNETSATEITVQMPKFKLEYEITLNDVLIALGMPKAFGASAEFPYLFEDITEGLFIDRVLHKAFIEVDEEGTEAAAATAVVIGKNMISGIFLNRPFIYMIRENSTGTILFIGKLSNPEV